MSISRQSFTTRFKAATAAQGLEMTVVTSGVHRELCRQVRIRSQTEEQARMKRAALYMSVSTVDQHPETQLLDLRQMAAQRGYEIVQEYTDRISGVKARRPGLDQMMADARRGRFDVVLGLGVRSHRPVDPAPPRGARRTESDRRRVRQLPRTDRHRRPAGPRHRRHHRRHRRARTHPDRRASARRHAARPPRRPTNRPSSAGTGQRRHPTRSSARPEHPTDRQRPSRFDGHSPTRAPQATPSTHQEHAA